MDGDQPENAEQVERDERSDRAERQKFRAVEELLKLRSESEITIEATVDTGFEFMAIKECREKFGRDFHVLKERGSIMFNIDKEKYPEVLQMRSVDNLHLVLSYAPSMGLKGTNSGEDVAVAKKQAHTPDWDTWLNVWKQLAKFEGILKPTPEQYAAANERATKDKEAEKLRQAERQKKFKECQKRNAEKRAKRKAKADLLRAEREAARKVTSEKYEASSAALASEIGKEQPVSNETEQVENKQPTKPEHAEKPTEPEHAEKPTEPEHAEKPTEPEHAEKTTEPEHIEKPTEPEHIEKPTESEHAEKPTEPEHAEKPTEPEHAEKPTEADHVEELTAPEHAEKPIEPEHAEKPTEPEHIEKPTEPELAEKPAELEHVEPDLKNLSLSDEPKDASVDIKIEASEEESLEVAAQVPVTNEDADSDDEIQSLPDYEREVEREIDSDVPPSERVLRFRATCFRVGKHAFGSMEVAREFGGELQEKFNWVVDLVNFNAEVILFLLKDTAQVSIALTKRSLHRRNISFFGPTTLRSTVCHNLLRLADIKPGDIILDPLAGGGSIPIEGAMSFEGTFLIGGDNHPKAVSRFYSNVRCLQEEIKKELPLGALRWDSRHLPLNEASVDVIVTDLPFGLRQGSKAGNRNLYKRVLLEMARVTRPGTGRAILLTQDRKSFSLALVNTMGLWWQSSVMSANIGGLDAAVFTLRRTAKIRPEESELAAAAAQAKEHGAWHDGPHHGGNRGGHGHSHGRGFGQRGSGQRGFGRGRGRGRGRPYPRGNKQASNSGNWRDRAQKSDSTTEVN